VVITRAEWGHGKRAGVLSDYTFAVWSGAELKEIGKAYSGLTDVEIDQLTARLQALTVSRNSHLHVVRPEIVLEVAFDGLQKSNRHASGFALRFPRIARIRDDKKPHEADTLDTVKALFEHQVGSGHREAPPQLSLFDLPPSPSGRGPG
jgi:DNA ligase 1